METSISLPTPSQILQSLYLLTASLILFLALLPSRLSSQVISYGARTSLLSPSPCQEKPSSQHALASALSRMRSRFLVRHHYFLHFYILSVLSSVFWLIQYVSRSRLLLLVLRWENAATMGPAAGTAGEAPAMATTPTSLVATFGGRDRRGQQDFHQVIAGWLMMWLQGTRRLYEDAFITRSSSESTMLALHWIFGLYFYGTVGVAVWIEGADTIFFRLASPNPSPITCSSNPTRIRLGVGFALFTGGWIMQHRCHKHLASLKKYSLPTDGWFASLVCPHYTCECMIYLGMAVATASAGHMINRTLLCALVLVASNLGVTANGTKKWYQGKFGADSTKDKWKMIPWVF